MSATADRGLSQGVAHFPGRAISDKANRIHIFTSWARGYENFLALEIVTQSEHGTNFANDGFGGSKTACARHTAGKITLVGVDDVNATRPKRFQIFLCGG